ncbi:Protein PilJ [Candidatus Propionivibrio aalborgensis]|uniref:Protein PilJ n=1 Tax=Candidatus Propionivibrio aalborgensis TaxID=1860101 RepID=A0A1A8Y1Q5_9RHOO|nr:methyl-accepting chemotaxis protein [Candidatus Propionivibrio aalborgensis]MBK7325860.1 type IV pili methyl-accepting chemotaxis transducer N-terminal domain-containing protein [Propionivibrio sp.]MBK7563656.1 type IV pili methyl-accepting chemotaxis transducer N-terminal domain-containing protein [Propionivibrio sp.]MBK9026896.1 type IV pili methyl-accepting chemotaxis transducer N-terminal domain-containing protein [Propionivibrio sp.]MBP6421803.1 type IV pili methyl-accepting chemotaxis 
MAFNLKLSGSNDAAGQTASDTTIMDDAQPIATKKSASGPGFLGQYSVIKQLQILGGAFLLIVVIIIAFVYRDNRESAFNSTYIATAGEMRMLSQRLAKASSLALQGNTSAFKQLRDSHSQFVTNLERLTKGGELAGTTVPPSPDDVQPQLQALTKTWSATDKDAVQLLDMETNLVALSKDVASITNKNPEMLELSEQVAALKLQSGAGVREIAAANQMVMLTQRIAKNASSLLVGDEISPEIAFLLGKDTNTFRELLNALQKGNENLRISGTTDADTKRKLGDLETSFKEYQDAVGGILGSMQRLTLAKRAGSSIFRNSEGLLESTDNLANAYQQGGRLAYGVTFAVLMFLALATLAMMAKVYLDDSRRQAETANESRQATESINRQNQDAILRLMNELGDLADGDLTVTATVSEDITGAIADSINYTIEELRVLVRRINDAAGRVTTATGIAQQTSVELLEAAQRQSEEIQAAGLSVLAMASSMTKVSGDADQSAQVARQSLAAAGKGTQAVQDSIKGMTEIREQIQETSKRIKRLGESSQEIGEIVELISDITEQTNVLALNAAIQAASAGDAGRGFTVVAEEVQRLAERSGEATKQIAAIVKTIQTDTQDAVSAMEESTHGVVEGARLSDATGQALAEIGSVSQNLAELIENISGATRQQADSATSVAGKMQDILRVTEQTTAGTQQTATAVGELADLATELKGSVAGFKVG